MLVRANIIHGCGVTVLIACRGAAPGEYFREERRRALDAFFSDISIVKNNKGGDERIENFGENRN